MKIKRKFIFPGCFLPHPPAKVILSKLPIVCWCCHKTCLAVWLINSHEKTAQFSGRASGQPRSRSSGGQRSRVHTQSLRPQGRTAGRATGLWLEDSWHPLSLLVRDDDQLMSDPLNNMRDKRTGHLIPRLWLNLIFHINMSATCQQDGWEYRKFSLILRKSFTFTRKDQFAGI